MASLCRRDIWVMIAVCFCVVAGNAALAYQGRGVVREVGFTHIKTLGLIMSGICVCG